MPSPTAEKRDNRGSELYRGYGVWPICVRSEAWLSLEFACIPQNLENLFTSPLSKSGTEIGIYRMRAVSQT